MPDGVVFYYIRVSLEIECFLDHVYRVEELPSEELYEFLYILAVTSDGHGCLVRVATYVAV